MAVTVKVGNQEDIDIEEENKESAIKIKVGPSDASMRTRSSVFWMTSTATLVTRLPPFLCFRQTRGGQFHWRTPFLRPSVSEFERPLPPFSKLHGLVFLT